VGVGGWVWVGEWAGGWVWVWIAVILPEWELLLCNLVNKITGWYCASINELRNFCGEISYSGIQEREKSLAEEEESKVVGAKKETQLILEVALKEEKETLPYSRITQHIFWNNLQGRQSVGGYLKTWLQESFKRSDDFLQLKKSCLKREAI